MKKVLLVLSVFASVLTVNAQDIENIFAPNEEMTTSKMSFYFIPEVKRVVEVEGKTALDLYNMVELAVANAYKNPDEVIDGNSPGKYLKFSGEGSPVIVAGSGLMILYVKTKCRYMFQFKDGKFMYTVKYDYYMSPSEYNTGGWRDMGLFAKVKNKKATQNITNSMKTLTDEVNGFIISVLTSEADPNLQDW
jgi:hypothetical protein